MDDLKLAIIGYGRMGKLVDKAAAELREEVVAKIDLDGWTPNALDNATSGIIFTGPDGGVDAVTRSLERGVDAIVGTTKFYIKQDGSINELMMRTFINLAISNNARMIYAANFSVGMNAFWKTLPQEAEVFAKLGYIPIVMEAHHTRKQDCPSGTASSIGRILLKSYQQYGKTGLMPFAEPIRVMGGASLDRMLMDSTHNETIQSYEISMLKELITKTPMDKIPIIGIRSGDIPGTHRIAYINPKGTDVVYKEHIVTDPLIFAKGAIESAHWLRTQAPGVYNIEDRINKS